MNSGGVVVGVERHGEASEGQEIPAEQAGHRASALGSGIESLDDGIGLFVAIQQIDRTAGDIDNDDRFSSSLALSQATTMRCRWGEGRSRSFLSPDASGIAGIALFALEKLVQADGHDNDIRHADQLTDFCVGRAFCRGSAPFPCRGGILRKEHLRLEAPPGDSLQEGVPLSGRPMVIALEGTVGIGIRPDDRDGVGLTDGQGQACHGF